MSVDINLYVPYLVGFAVGWIAGLSMDILEGWYGRRKKEKEGNDNL